MATDNIIAHQVKFFFGGGRNGVIDCVKCYLIFLVVFGHVLLSTTTFYEDRVTQACISWIWFFHMPAFALVSGYVFNPFKPAKQLIESSLKLLLTYVIMQSLITLIYGPRDIKSYFLIPQYAMWYLPALVVWRICAYIGVKITNNLFVLLSLGVIISVASGFIPISYLGFQRVCSFLPFFVLGMIYREKDVVNFLRKRTVNRILALCLLVVLFLAFLFPGRTICSGMCNVPYKSIFQFFTRLSVLLLGTIMTSALLCVAPIHKCVSFVGRRTLFIYCYHVFFILHLIPFIWIFLGISPSVFVILIYTCIVFFILVLLSNNKYLNIIINPFYKWKFQL